MRRWGRFAPPYRGATSGPRGPLYARTHEVELDGGSEASILTPPPVRLVMDVLASAAEGGGIARHGEEFQMFGGRGCTIDEPTKPVSPMEAVA